MSKIEPLQSSLGLTRQYFLLDGTDITDYPDPEKSCHEIRIWNGADLVDIELAVELPAVCSRDRRWGPQEREQYRHRTIAEVRLNTAVDLINSLSVRKWRCRAEITVASGDAREFRIAAIGADGWKDHGPIPDQRTRYLQLLCADSTELVITAADVAERRVAVRLIPNIAHYAVRFANADSLFGHERRCFPTVEAAAGAARSYRPWPATRTETEHCDCPAFTEMLGECER